MKREKTLILALDGGGIRGVYTAAILQRLVTESERDILIDADLIAGTSTGGILALGLASGLPPERIVAMYRQHATKIFPWWRRKLLKGIFCPKFRQEPLAEALQSVLGDKKMCDLEKEVAITSFNLADWRVKVWDRSDDMRCLDVGLMTSAAPGFFPVHRGHIDGGVFANVPVGVGIVGILKKKMGADVTDDNVIPVEDLCVLSIGTGESKPKVPGIIPDGPTSCGLHWHVTKGRLIDVLISAPSTNVVREAEEVFDGKFLRINSELKKDIPLDDGGAVDELIKIAEETDLSEAITWVKENWRRHPEKIA